MSKYKRIIISVFSIILMDQLTKVWIRMNLKFLETVTIIKDFFFITHTKNTGGAWSILEGNQLLLISISMTFLIILALYIKKETNLTNLSLTSYSLIIGGIIGNLIDRIFLNGVIDFLSFKIVNYYFPIFNIADIAIVIGVMLLMIDIIRSEVHERNKSSR